MRSADLIVGVEYAFRRSSYGIPVKVIYRGSREEIRKVRFSDFRTPVTVLVFSYVMSGEEFTLEKAGCRYIISSWAAWESKCAQREEQARQQMAVFRGYTTRASSIRRRLSALGITCHCEPHEVPKIEPRWTATLTEMEQLLDLAEKTK